MADDGIQLGDLDAAYSAHQGRTAAAQLAGVQDVPPSAAVSAIDAAPTSNVPPSLGMHDLPTVTSVSRTNTNAAILQSSAPVRNFVATADPAHVAAVQEDLPALARVGQLASDFARKVFTPQGNVITGPVQENAVQSGIRGLAEQAAGYLYSQPGTSRQQAGQNLIDIFQTALAGVRGMPEGMEFRFGEGFVAKPSEGVPPPPPSGPPHVTPQGPNTTPEGFVADEAGAPVHFTSQRDAATWASQNAPSTGNRFDIAVNEAGNAFHVQEVPLVDPSVVAEGDAKDIAGLQEEIGNSTTHSTSPAIMENYLEQQVAGHTAAVDPDTLLKLASQGVEPFPESAGAIVQAAHDGTDLELPLSRYLAATAGQPFADGLNEATRFRADGVSQLDAKENTATPTTQVQPGSTLPPTDLTPQEAQRAQYLAAEAQTQLQRVVQSQYLEGLFTKAKDIGMTKDQLARYSEGIQGLVQDASDRMLQRAYDQVLRERKPDWKASVAQHSATVEQELAQRPDVQARAGLLQNRGPLGEPLETPALKIARDDPLAGYVEDLGLGKALSRNGIASDDIARLYNYRSGADMVRDVAALEAERSGLGLDTIKDHMKAMVRDEAERWTRSELGFDLTPEAIHAAASEMVNSPALTDFLTQELQDLAQRAGLPFDKAAITNYARARFGDMAVKDALNIKQLEAYVYKGGVKAEKALLKGDFTTAFIRKQQQFIHHLELAEAHKFAKEFKSTQRTWKRVADNATLANTAQDAVNQVKKILAATGRQVVANPLDLANSPSLSEFIRAKSMSGAELIHAPVVPMPAEQMTTAQYRGMADMIKSILKNGRAEKEVQVGDTKRALEDAVAEGVSSLNQYKRTINETELRHPDTLQRIDAARRAVDAWLVRQEQLLVRDFGAGDYNSPFFQVVTKRLQEQKGWANDKRIELAKHFRGMQEATGGKAFRKWLQARTSDVGPHAEIVTRNGDKVLVTNQDILMAALHMGDEVALGKFAEGYNTTPAQVEAAVHEVMTDPAWNAVEGIWDAFNKLRPDIEAMYRRLTDVTPTMVEPRPFTSPSGRVFKGGYFPVRYDPASMPKEWTEALDPQAMLGDMQYQRATPANGYIKERTGVSAPVSLDFNSIHSRLNQVIHDLAFREVLMDAEKFLMHPDMTNAITRKYGPEYVAKLRNDLKHIAGSESMTTNNNRGIAKFVNYLTEGQMVNMIGYSPTTLLKHGSSAFAQGIRVVGPARFTVAAQEFFKNPREAFRQATAESPEIRHVYSAVGEDARREFLALTENAGVSKAVRMFAFQTIGLVNKTVATIVYNAAKLKVAEEDPSLDEATVRAAAEHLVRQGIGSSGAADAPEALRSDASIPGQAYRLSNQFLTFLNHMYNISREAGQSAGFGQREGDKVQLGSAFATLLAAIIIPAYAEFAVIKKSLNVFGHWAEALVHQTLGPIPLANTMVGSAMKQAGVKYYPGGDSTLESIGGEVGNNMADLNKLIHGKPFTNKMVKHGLITAGQFGRFPGLEAARVEGFLSALAQGRENKPFNQVLGDLVYGPKEPR